MSKPIKKIKKPMAPSPPSFKPLKICNSIGKKGFSTVILKGNHDEKHALDFINETSYSFGILNNCIASDTFFSFEALKTLDHSVETIIDKILTQALFVIKHIKSLGLTYSKTKESFIFNPEQKDCPEKDLLYDEDQWVITSRILSMVLQCDTDLRDLISRDMKIINEMKQPFVFDTSINKSSTQ